MKLFIIPSQPLTDCKSMKSDIAFVHAPSIYDFRKREIKEGPIGDVIPSTPLFEMYPIGFVSMLNHVLDNGFSGRISNLAVLMLDSAKFDAEKYIRNMDADIFGIDFHWLPHVHGAFNIAKIIKKYHPDKKVLLGGFSSSYFAGEIMEKNNDVDFILAGDFVEKQLITLMRTLEGSRPLEGVPNLWYRKEGRTYHNEPLKDRNPTDAVFINYGILVKNSILYHDIKGHLPYYSWIKNPMGMTIIQRGCQFNCGFCGGSNFAYKSRYYESSPVRRDPGRVADEIEIVQDTINSPVFIAGDLNQAGPDYYLKFFKELKDRGIDLPLLTEYFVPPGREYFMELSKNVDNFACEISPDSSIKKIREETGRFYTNEQLEKSVELAREFGSRKFDIYFSIGLPFQTKDSVIEDTDYMERLLKTYNSKEMPLYGFISPLAPFIDPGSLFYEMPDRYGFNIYTKGVMDFYELLDRGKQWDEFINYDTRWMSKKDMVEATYLSGIKMVEIGSKLGYIEFHEKQKIVHNIMSYINGADYDAHEDMSKHLTYLVKEIEWSRKHGITGVSILIFLYSMMNRMRSYIINA